MRAWPRCAQLPFADLRDLERDRRLNRIGDLFTVDLLSSFISWKLDRSSAVSSDAHAQQPQNRPEDLSTSVVLTESRS